MRRTNPFVRGLVIYGLGLLVALGCWVIGHPLVGARPVQSVRIAAASTTLTSPPKVVFFGSSTTVGVGATRGDRRWSTLLSRYLGWEEYNESLSGSSLSKAPRSDKSWPIPSAVERWRDAVLRRHPDRVVLLYGANDVFWNLPLGNDQTPGTFKGDTATLLTEMTTAFRPEQLVIVTPQPNQATQDRRAPYDAVLEAGAKRIGAPFIDAVKDTLPATDLAGLSADGLHLNNLGHAAFASSLASQLADRGIAAAPPQALGGNRLPHASMPLSGGFLRVDMAHPLSFGEIRQISAHWAKSGQARFVILRPDGRGGYDAVYRTGLMSVSPGTSRTIVPRWWVLEGDRLGVWTDADCLSAVASKTARHLALPRPDKYAIADINPGEGTVEPYTLALWIDAATPLSKRG